MSKSEINRCGWVNLANPTYIHYHDHEWGNPEFDDNRLFELLTLEGAQAGLSWETVLSKRENYRLHFNHFDIDDVAQFSTQRLESILTDPGIIRHRGKIYSVVSNANAILSLRKTGISFSKYLWSYVGGQPLLSYPQTLSDVPAYTEISTRLSKDLKKRGFKFVGKTIIYAFMQASGMVNDHLTSCFRSPSSPMKQET